MIKQEFQDKVLDVFAEPSKTLDEWDERKTKYYSVLNEAICFLLEELEKMKGNNDKTSNNL